MAAQLPEPAPQPQLGSVVLQLVEHSGQVPTLQFVTVQTPLAQKLSVPMLVSLQATPWLIGTPA
jgi:hypothetical protein